MDPDNTSSDKILHISASYKPANIYGGPIISVAALCENLTAVGIRVDVVTTTANGKQDFSYNNGEKATVDGVSVIYFKRLTGDHSHFSPALYSFLLKNIHNYAVVHIHAWWNLVTIGAAFVCWLKGKKYVLSPRGTLGAYSFSNRSGFLKNVFHILLGKKLLAQAVFQVSSKKEADDIKKIIPKATIAVIPNFVNLISSNPNGQPKENGILKLLFFSRIEQKKGLNFLLEALALVKEPFTLSIFGDGDSSYISDLKQLVPQNVICNVTWHKAVYGIEKFNVFANHNILILPSFDENFANVIIESLAVGTAVIITEKVGLSDYVIENNFGWICDQTAENISRNINDVAINTAELRRIRREAPVKIKEDFNKSKLIAKYLKFYKN